MKKRAAALMIVGLSLILVGCSSTNSSVNNVIDSPNKSSTEDEIYPAQNDDAVEESENVNGMRFTLTLAEFTDEYNLLIEKIGGSQYLSEDNWKKTGDSGRDSNGVGYEYYYYDCDKYNLTATVETESQKLMNVGCGTTMSIFVSQDNGENYSDVILEKSALAAAAACGFPSSSLSVLEDIFYRTTFENAESLWYQGCVFNLSVDEDKNSSENSTMLFRVFPLTDELKDNWDVIDYEEYIATAPTENSNADND